MNDFVTAQLNFVRTSPRRMRLMADLIRGKRVTRALSNLAVLNQKTARLMFKLLNSAVANAKHNNSYKVEDLIVKTVTVDGGPMLKRFIPKAHGRATPVRERTAHVSLVLANLPKPAKVAAPAKAAKTAKK